MSMRGARPANPTCMIARAVRVFLLLPYRSIPVPRWTVDGRWTVNIRWMADGGR